MSGCVIGKIKMKSGGAEIRIIPTAHNNTLHVNLGYAEVVLRAYDGKPINYATAIYMLEQAKNELMFD